MHIALLVIIVVFILLFGSSLLFATKVIYPKVLSIDETRQIELENQRFNETEYKQWQQNGVNLPSPFGYQLACAYFPIPGAQKTIIISHGITYSRYGSIKYMPLFRKHGFNILIYDLRNHGLSGGSNTTFGLYEKFDLQILVDWAFQQLDSDGIVGTMGESLGAATTLQHAAIDNRISFAIADCPYSDLTELLKYRLKEEYRLPAFPLLNLANLFCKLLARMDFEHISPIKGIPAITTPIYWIHGQNDDYIPPEMSEQMYNAKIDGVKKIHIVPNSAHAEALINNPVEYGNKIDEFLAELHLTEA
ncbi:MAG: alpha/beta hydrolase [Anaerolineaceae bacterium]|nr:alpha/beta hydrolase [Anaerolineaceae bacterium]